MFLRTSFSPKGLLVMLIGVSVLTFSSLIYFAEKESTARWSFPDSFWWVELADSQPWGRSAPTSTRISRVTKKSNLKQNYFIMQPRVHLCGGQNGTELGPPQLCKYVNQIRGRQFCRSNAGSGKSKFSNDLSVVSV